MSFAELKRDELVSTDVPEGMSMFLSVRQYSGSSMTLNGDPIVTIAVEVYERSLCVATAYLHGLVWQERVDPIVVGYLTEDVVRRARKYRAITEG